VLEAFAPTARFDVSALRATTRLAVRFLDNIIEISRFPLFRQREQVRRSRRIGLGITGLADALAMLGLRYDEERARVAAASVMRTIRDAAYAASIELAREKGAFPAFDRVHYAAGPFIRSLPDELQAAILRHGIRNSHLLAIAPAGTVSLLADNVSSGIEPIFGLETVRRVLDRDGKHHDFRLVDPAYAAWRAARAQTASPPAFFPERDSLTPQHHLLMQAALQPFVDGAISKTITLSRTCTPAEMPAILERAYELGLKGCTVYRCAARPGVLVDHPELARARDGGCETRPQAGPM
jgi:ribonucleoside-diphosphate reductase alpha chain